MTWDDNNNCAGRPPKLFINKERKLVGVIEEELDKILEICAYEMTGNTQTEYDKLPGQLKKYAQIRDITNNILDTIRESRMG